MPDFNLNIAMSIRAYGCMTISAETQQDALASLTKDLVSDGFTPHGGSDDFCYDEPENICITAVENLETGEEDDSLVTLPDMMSVWTVTFNDDYGSPSAQVRTSKEAADQLAMDWITSTNAFESDQDAQLMCDNSATWEDIYQHLSGNHSDFRDTCDVTMHEIDMTELRP